VSKIEIITLSAILADFNKINNWVQMFQIAKDLHKVNVQSVNARYNEKSRYSAIKFYDFEFNGYDFKAIPDAQKAKLIDCYLYQCSCKKGYKNIQVIKDLHELRESLIFNDNDHDAAKWGIELADLPLNQRESHQDYWNRINGFGKDHVTR
jgi:hypothetical protein